MDMTRLALLAGAALLACASTAAAQDFRIGFITTLSGAGAGPGTEGEKGFKVGLKHEGWTKNGDKFGGLTTNVYWGDDQQKPDAGVREADKLLEQEKVHVVSGIIWSNVALAVAERTIAKKVPLLITNAGASQFAGEKCHPLITTTSWNNDQVPEALGKRMNDDQIQSIYMLAPNYQAGKDMIAGVKRTLKGPKIVSEDYFKLGETDFQANISKVRASGAKAVFLFAPGGMGVAFFKNWEAAGAGKNIKLYTVFTVDWSTLPAIGDAAIGTYHTMYWNVDLPNEANKKFVKEYNADYGRNPSHYAAQAYDAARLLAASVKAIGGKIEDEAALGRAFRKTKYDSIRGPYEYNVNGVPIQNFYLREVVKGGDGKPAIVTKGIVFEKHKDAYWEKCPADKRV
jgi:branched-chain amino acid transport system substrate-binding protein